MPLFFYIAYLAIDVLIGILLLTFLLSWFPIDRKGEWGLILRGIAILYFAIDVLPSHAFFSGRMLAVIFLLVYPSLPVRNRIKIFQKLHAIIDPLMRPIDALIPSFGGISLSGLLVLIILRFVQSTLAQAMMGSRVIG